MDDFILYFETKIWDSHQTLLFLSHE
jgi:hypothetical protein